MARSTAKPNTEGPSEASAEPTVEAASKTSNKPRSDARRNSTSKKDKSSTSSSPSPPDAGDLSDIHLDGEDTESVPTYASCDDIRKLINANLPQTTKAAFCRMLTELLPSSKVTTRNLDQLLKMKGARAGAHNIAFYASYVYFEKIRVKEGKKKSAKRIKMEEMWGKEGGLPREGSHEMGMFCRAGERPVIDQYGWMIRKGQPRPGSIYRKKPRAG